MPASTFSVEDMEILRQLAAREKERRKAADASAGRGPKPQPDALTEAFSKMGSAFSDVFGDAFFQTDLGTPRTAKANKEPAPVSMKTVDDLAIKLKQAQEQAIKFSREVLELSNTERALRTEVQAKDNRIRELEDSLRVAAGSLHTASVVERELRERIHGLAVKIAAIPAQVPVPQAPVENLPALPWWSWSPDSVTKHGNVRISTGDGEQGSDILYLTIYPDVLNHGYGTRLDQAEKLKAMADFICAAPKEITSLRNQVAMLIKQLDEVGTRV